MPPHREGGSAQRGGPDDELKNLPDEKFERGVGETFPGSDPVSVTQPPPHARDKHKY